MEIIPEWAEVEVIDVIDIIEAATQAAIIEPIEAEVMAAVEVVVVEGPKLVK